jgi:drug/metabolite transporter (DMT)-like permease
MAYLFLSLALLAGVSKGFCGKRISAYTPDFKSAAFSNSVRMLLCIVIGFFFALVDAGFSSLVPSGALILISLLSGVSTAGFVIMWLFAVRRGAYVLVDIFLTLGTLLSAVLSVVFYGARFNIFDIIGFALLFVAVLFMCSYSIQIKKSKLTLSTLLVLIVCAMANGISDFSMEIFNREVGREFTASVFNFYTFIFAAITLLLVFAFSKSTEESRNNIKYLSRGGLVYISLMAAFLFLNVFFKTLAAKDLNMATISPLSQGSALVLVTVMSAVFFGERIKPRCIVGVVLAISALLIMNLL